jgi:mRNA interferase YafQ
MKYSIEYENSMRRDIKVCKKRGYNLSLLHEVISKLANGETLDRKHRDHALTGKLKTYRECHIKDDWLLVYKIEKEKLILCLVYTGTHKDFGWS